MARTRTREEINNDYKECRKYVDEHPTITSLKEIATAVGLTESQVKTSLSQHPRVFNRIKQLIANNQDSVKAQKKAVKKDEDKPDNLETAKNDSIGIVIDASITGTLNVMDTINNLCDSKNKIILTSITIKELEKLQKFNDPAGIDARRILALAAGDYEHFECVLIDENIGCPDDCIIKYCADNKDNVILFTADKTMVLKARTYGVKTNFLKQDKNTPTFKNRKMSHKSYTLFLAKKVGTKLIISDFGNDFKSVRVISNGIEFNAGVVELQIGDDIYIAAKKNYYMTFSHYKITSLFAENNCKIVFSKHIYDKDDINNLPEASYKSFMRDFKSKINF